MKVSCLRAALLTGASIMTIAVPMRVLAATTTHPGISHVDTTDPVEDTLVICALNDDCFFGIEAEGSGTVGASLNDVASGRIEQTGTSISGDVDLVIENRGEAELAAHAKAAGDGSQSAVATVIQAISQHGSGEDEVTLDLSNTGSLLVDGSAQADGDTAHAMVHIGSAIAQNAMSDHGKASIALKNNGSLAVEGSAKATAEGGAVAVAFMSEALLQYASGQDEARLLLDNKGDLEVTLAAQAAGITATANAGLLGAIVQTAIVDGTNAHATASLVNDGTISIGVVAYATGDVQAKALAGGTASSFWDPTVGLIGISQAADAGLHGAALASLTNSGTINIGAHAVALAADAANATAAAGTAILQSAHGATADAALVNQAHINISAQATAIANDPGELGVKALATVTSHGIVQGAIATDKLVYVPPVGTDTGTVTTWSPGDDAWHRDSLEPPTAALANSGIFQLGGPPIFIMGSGSITGTSTPGYIHPLGPATASLENSGTINFELGVAVEGGNLARGSAVAYGLSQVAWGTEATASIVNKGDIGVHGEADAKARGYAAANVYNQAIVQLAETTAIETSFVHRLNTPDQYLRSVHAQGPAHASFTNEGTLELAADAHAISLGGANGAPTSAWVTTSAAYANAIQEGIRQAAAGTDASVELVNSGKISIHGEAAATGLDNAYANAAGGVAVQGALAIGGTEACIAYPSANYCVAGGTALGPASVSAINEATIEISQHAVAHGEDKAWVTAAGSGFLQAAAGTAAHMAVYNRGELKIDAAGTATADGSAVAQAFGLGAYAATGVSGTTVSHDFDNSGTLEIDAAALAVGGESGLAFAAVVGDTVRAYAVRSASYAIHNSGTFSIDASAKAEGDHFAGGTAIAFGVQVGGFVHKGDVTFSNSGNMTVNAAMHAVADADQGFAGAAAFAHGFYAEPTEIVAHIHNPGDLKVSARATAEGASGWAQATAAGIALAAIGGSSYGAVTGTITNDGTIDVMASAHGIVDEVDAQASTAEAVGILLFGASTSGTITNSGTIDVTAIIGSADGLVQATGIRAEAPPEPAEPAAEAAEEPPAEDPVLIISNSGTITVKQSTDGGKTFQRGLAIDVSQAPNASVINLLDGGKIYGNIAIQDGDTINVRDGETLLDGVINPQCVPGAYINGDDPALSSCGVGTLNIVDKGVLVLADPRISGDPKLYDGPSYAFVKEFNIDASGTLALALEPDKGGVQAAGSYQQVFADTANVDGTLEARFAPKDGLFADSYSWDNVVDANTLEGKFDHCVIGGAYAGSLLLDLDCAYDSGNNVDLKLTRVAFNAVDGLNRNAGSLASALEEIYGPGLTGGIADLVGDLFLIGDAADYNTALNQVSGSSYANYLQSFPSLGVHLNDLADKATSCEVPALAGSVLECRADPIHIWGQLDYQKHKADGDAEAGSYRSKRFAGLLGIDFSVGGSAILGLSGGSVRNHVRDRQFGDNVKADGYQLGAYGVFDPGTFYVKGMVSYSWFDGDSRRNVDLEPLGGSFAATLSGDPSVLLWAFGLHGGYRLPIGKASVLTPYLNVDRVSAELRHFTETTINGDDGVELNVAGGAARRTYVTGGVKWASQVGALTPELNLGYRYYLGDRRSRFAAEGIGGEDSPFVIVSAAQKRGTLVGGLSLGGRVGPADFRIAYEGEYNGDVTSHSGSLKIVLPLGGKDGAATAQPSQ